MLITGCGNFYQTIGLLGTGSFGSVYHVRDISSGFDYACKIISKQLIIKYDANSMIQNEIAIHSQCHHKNIVKYYSSWDDQNNIYILMEYCSKGHLVNPKTPFNNEDVFQIFHQVLDGVDYLHKLRIIHRDLKLENILIHEDGTLKLCDFGWAVQVQTLPVPNVMCGTTEYMPPEVVAKQVLDFKLDSWSLGIILYLLVDGKFPFNGRNQQELIEEILFNQCPIPKRKDVDENIILLVQGLLIKNQSLRPSVEQIYLCKWMKVNMKLHNIFNHYENEQLKQKFKSKNITLKCVHESQQVSPKKMLCSQNAFSRDDSDNSLLKVKGPFTGGKLHSSSREITLTVSTNPSPGQTEAKHKKENFFSFLDHFKPF